MHLTAAQLIDIAGMRAIYAHLGFDPEISDALQVKGQESDLAEIGQWFIESNTDEVEKAFKDKRIEFYTVYSIPADNAIYCLYLPPYYFFVDLDKKYE